MRNNDGPESHDAPPHPIHEEAIHLGGEERDATRRHNPTAYPGRAGDPRYTTRPKTALKFSHAHDFLRGATLPSVQHAYIPYVCHVASYIILHTHISTAHSPHRQKERLNHGRNSFPFYSIFLFTTPDYAEDSLHARAPTHHLIFSALDLGQAGRREGGKALTVGNGSARAWERAG